MKHATIVGSRRISNEEFIILRDIATRLCFRGYILRSGAADGADSTINHLCRVEIILPWNGFNGFYHDGIRVFSLDKLPHKDLAEKRALQIHPRPDLLTNTTKKFHTRNIYQIIGPRGADGVKSNIVVYCTDDDLNGEPTGGTRTAVMYGRELDVPTYNIRNKGIDVNKIFNEILNILEKS